MFVRSLNSKTLSSQLQAYSFSEAFDPPDNITASNDTAVQLLKRKMVSSLVSEVENYDHAQQKVTRAALAKIYYESQFELAINSTHLSLPRASSRSRPRSLSSRKSPSPLGG